MLLRSTLVIASICLLDFCQGVLAQQATGMSKGGYSLKLHGKIDPRFKKGDQPQIHMTFSIEKEDGTRIDRLEQNQIDAHLLKKVESGLEPADKLNTVLVETGSKSSAVPVLFMLDISGSMLHPEDTKDETFNKLTVVKDAMRAFVDSGKLSSLEIATFFDAGMEHTVLRKSDSAADARVAIDQIEASHDDRPTALYHAVIWAIQEAKEQEIRHIVFLTDGQDETYGGYQNFVKLKHNATPEETKGYLDWQSRDQEPAVIDLALKSGKIFIHTIGIGNPNAGLFRNSFTDCDTLKEISNKTFGHHECIDTVGLRNLSQNVGSTVAYHESLSTRLTSVLAQLRENFLYNYDLGLAINRNYLHSGENVARAEFQVEKQVLYVDVRFDWDGSAITDPMGETGFLPPPQSDVDLNPIALPIGGALAALSLIPLVFTRVAISVQAKRQRKSLMILKSGSQYIGKECPEERSRMGNDYLFKSGDPIVVCPQCRTPHHLDCWINAGSRCYVQHCRAVVPVSEKDLDRMGFQSSV